MAMVPAGGAVEFLGAAFGDDGDGATGVAAVFGGVVGLEDFDFGDGIHGGHGVDGAVGTGVQVSDAVDGHVLGVAAAAGDVEIADGGGGGGFAGVGGVDDAGEEADGVHDVATFEGHGFDVGGGEGACFFGGAEGDGDGFGFDGDGFGSLADFEFDGAEGALGAGGDFDVGLFVLVEAGGVDFEGIGGGGEIGEGEEAGFIGAGEALEAGAVAGDRDFDVGDGGAGGILDGAGEGA